jgi:hypothetical protein
MHWDDDFSVIKRQMEADWLHPFLHLGLWMQQPGPFPQVTIPVYANVADITKHLHSLHTEAAASPTPLTLWNYGMHMFPLTHEYLWRQWKAYGITSADKLILCLEGFVPVAEPSNRFGYHICVLATASIIAAVIAWNPPVKEICLTGLGTYHALFEEVWQDIPVQYPQEDEDDSDFRNHAFYNLLRNYPFKYWQVLHLMDYDGENVVVGPKRTNEFLYGQRSEMAWQQKVWGAVFKRYRWELKA